MSVVVKNLTKRYGTQMALNGISFSAKKGEILGFLGPNGAGKSTCMKILTGYIPPTDGDAEVAGFNIHSDTIKMREKVGYLPENNPLYKDMYVKEYLYFVADIYTIKNKKQRVAELIEQTGLTDEQQKVISSLSKGYRQRVGLAQALMNDPEVLILDEPVSGLDPNQLVEIRHLIKSISKEKTIILSTHIMQEVEALCDRIVIINKGEIVADDTVAVLQDKMRGRPMFEVEFQKAVSLNDLKKMNQLESARSEGSDKRWQLTFKAATEEPGAMVFDYAKNNGHVLLEMKRLDSKLENVFFDLTH